MTNDITRDLLKCIGDMTLLVQRMIAQQSQPYDLGSGGFAPAFIEKLDKLIAERVHQALDKEIESYVGDKVLTREDLGQVLVEEFENNDNLERVFRRNVEAVLEEEKFATEEYVDNAVKEVDTVSLREVQQEIKVSVQDAIELEREEMLQHMQDTISKAICGMDISEDVYKAIEQRKEIMALDVEVMLPVVRRAMALVFNGEPEAVAADADDAAEPVADVAQGALVAKRAPVSTENMMLRTHSQNGVNEAGLLLLITVTCMALYGTEQGATEEAVRECWDADYIMHSNTVAEAALITATHILRG